MELKVQNDQIIDELKKNDISVKNYMSSIDEDVANLIRDVFGDNKATQKKATAKTKSKSSTKAKAKASPKSAPKSSAKKKAAPKTEAKTKKAESENDEASAGDHKKSTKAKSTTKAKIAAPKAKDSRDAAAKSKAKRKVKAEAKPGEEGHRKKTDAPKGTEKPTSKQEVLSESEEAKLKASKKHGLKITKKEEKAEEENKGKPPTKAEGDKAKHPGKAESPPETSKTSKSKPEKQESDSKPAETHDDMGFEKAQLSENMSIRDLGDTLKCSPNEIIKDLMSFGILATINQSLDVETASKIADKRGFEVEIVSPESELEMEETEVDKPEDHKPRPPIVTIMGHVDHGKTSLLDAIRETNLTQSEKGGITQHIGAYEVKYKNYSITFLDTPGHEAFTAMRARGAQVTDIVVLVVAADDGIKPQTEEAIDHANAAKVPIVVAINKIDKPDAKPDEVKKQLADLGLLPEDWGGQTIFTEVSAIQKTGIDTLLEMLHLQAEIMELKSNPKLMAQGIVIESKLDKGRGPVATVIVEKGTLSIGDPFIAGAYFGKVRALINDHGRKTQSAGPSVPVEILGLPEVPQPGERFFAVRDERKARQISQSRMQRQREANLANTSRITMDDLHRQILEGKIQELNLIIKADVQGSIQAVKEAFAKLDSDEIRIKVIHGAVGGITESDILLSTASNAIVIGFNVRPTEQASTLAARENVDVRLYGVIYDAINDMKKAMDGMLEPKFKERITGRAEVREVFSIPKIGVIAGCMVLSGNLERNFSARLIRDSVVVYEGKIHSLRRFKDDVKEVPSGYECGLALEKYQDLKQGDIVEPFVLEKVNP